MATYERADRSWDREDAPRVNRPRLSAAPPGRSYDRSSRGAGGIDRSRRGPDPRSRGSDYDADVPPPRRATVGRRGSPPSPPPSRGGPPPARRTQRPTYDDDDGPRGPRDPGRAARGGRPPLRDDVYGPPRGRDMSPGPRGDPRGRPPARGGIWDDEPPRRGRPSMGDPRGMRDGPRYQPRGRHVEDEEEPSGLGAGKALGIIVLCFILGAGAAFGFFKLSAPRVNTNSSAPGTAAPAASPATTPGTTPSPHALALPSGRHALFEQVPSAL